MDQIQAVKVIYVFDFSISGFGSKIQFQFEMIESRESWIFL